MLLFLGCFYFRGVLISVVSLFQSLNGVFLFQWYPYFRGVLISRVSLFQWYPYFRGVLISEDVLISGVSLFQESSYGGVPLYNQYYDNINYTLEYIAQLYTVYMFNNTVHTLIHIIIFIQVLQWNNGGHR